MDKIIGAVVKFGDSLASNPAFTYLSLTIFVAAVFWVKIFSVIRAKESEVTKIRIAHEVKLEAIRIEDNVAMREQINLGRDTNEAIKENTSEIIAMREQLRPVLAHLDRLIPILGERAARE